MCLPSMQLSPLKQAQLRQKKERTAGGGVIGEDSASGGGDGYRNGSDIDAGHATTIPALGVVKARPEEADGESGAGAVRGKYAFVGGSGSGGRVSVPSRSDVHSTALPYTMSEREGYISLYKPSSDWTRCVIQYCIVLFYTLLSSLLPSRCTVGHMPCRATNNVAYALSSILSSRLSSIEGLFHPVYPMVQLSDLPLRDSKRRQQ